MNKWMRAVNRIESENAVNRKLLGLAVYFYLAKYFGRVMKYE